MSRMPPRIANSPCSSAGSSLREPGVHEQLGQIGRGNILTWLELERCSEQGDSARSHAATAPRPTRRRLAQNLCPRHTAPVLAPTSRLRAAQARDTDRFRVTETAGPQPRPPLSRALRPRRGRNARRRPLLRGPRQSGRHTASHRAVELERRPRRTAPLQEVSPETTRAGTSMPLRATAVLRTARRFSEVAVDMPNCQCSIDTRTTLSLTRRIQ